MVAGYLGTLLTQTVTFAADEFDASKTAQSTALAVVRVGVLATMLITALADRRGRRRLLLLSASVGCAACALGALAPNLVGLTLSQLVVRTMVSACTVLLTVIAAEEMPAGAAGLRHHAARPLRRARGRRVPLRPPAGRPRRTRAWRVLYLLPLLGLPLVLRWAGRLLPESRRYEVPHDDVADARAHRAASGSWPCPRCCSTLFKDPASQLLNEFLRDERGFSATRISLFSVVTNLPGLIGVVVGGRLADARGRRGVGAVAVLGGRRVHRGPDAQPRAGRCGCCRSSASIIAAAAIPALGVYGPELFPTSLRGRANGVIARRSASSGTIIGLVVAGVLSDRWDGLGPALAVLSVGPLIVGVLVLRGLPRDGPARARGAQPRGPRAADRGQPSAATQSLTASASAASFALEVVALALDPHVLDRPGDRRGVVLQLGRRAERVLACRTRTGTGTVEPREVLDAQVLRLARRVQRIGDEHEAGGGQAVGHGDRAHAPAHRPAAEHEPLGRHAGPLGQQARLLDHARQQLRRAVGGPAPLAAVGEVGARRPAAAPTACLDGDQRRVGWPGCPRPGTAAARRLRPCLRPTGAHAVSRMRRASVSSAMRSAASVGVAAVVGVGLAEQVPEAALHQQPLGHRRAAPPAVDVEAEHADGPAHRVARTRRADQVRARSRPVRWATKPWSSGPDQRMATADHREGPRPRRRSGSAPAA